MARFYATIQGNRGEASRMGTKKTGIQGHIRGWDIGCKVLLNVDSEGKDMISIYLTSGSNNQGWSRFLGQFRAEDLEGSKK